MHAPAKIRCPSLDTLATAPINKSFRQQWRKPVAEFIGTMVFMTIGLCGTITDSTTDHTGGFLLPAFLGWGFGVMTAIYIVRGVSGAHMNPTVSLVFAVFRGHPARRDLWKYVVAQLLGSVAAAALVYGLYHDAIVDKFASNMAGLGPKLWCSPRDGLGYTAAFFNEFVATAILVATVLALADCGDPATTPLILGFVTVGLEVAFAHNTGSCLNPSRDLGPRVVLWCAGLASFGANDAWFVWGPWVATVWGGLFGAYVYDFIREEPVVGI